MAKRASPALDSQRVEQLLAQRGWRPADLAKAMDVESYAITKWLKYGQAPSGYDAARMAQILGVSAAYLFGMSEPETIVRRLMLLVTRLPAPHQAAVYAFALQIAEPNLSERVSTTQTGDEEDATVPVAKPRRRRLK